MKNRTIIGAICIALAVVIMFGVSPFLSILSAEKIDVVQVNKTILEGHQITEKDVTTVTIGKFGSPASIIRNKEDVVGKYATSNLYKDTNLIPAMLTNDVNNTESFLQTLDDEHVAISITVPSFASALSGKLQNGDIVSVIVNTNDNSSKDTFIPEELQYVRVITTTTSEGVDRDGGEKAADGKENLPATITLHVTPAQALRLAEHESSSKIHMALVCRGDSEQAEKYLSEQDAVLAEIAEREAAEAAEAETLENGGEIYG